MKKLPRQARSWAAAISGTAMLGLSAFTGISAANAASSGGPLGSLVVTAGTIPGSGTVTLTSNNVVKSVTTFDNPGCATLPPQYSGANMAPSTITIGTRTYSAPAVSPWHEGAVFSENTLSGVFCEAPDGSVINGVNAKVSQHRLAWQVDYSCQPAGTPVKGALLADPSPDTVEGSPTTLPANGTLPEACGATTPPQTRAALALSKAQGVAGSPFVITGTGYHLGETVTLQFHSTPTTLGTATVKADGSFSLSTAVPGSATPGAHTVTATAPSTGTQSLAFTVTKANGGPGNPGTPSTSIPTPTPIPTPTDNGSTPAPTGSSSGATAGGSPVVTNSGGAVPVGAPTSTPPAGRGLGIQTAVASHRADASGQFVWSATAGVAGIGLVTLAFVTGRRRKHVED